MKQVVQDVRRGVTSVRDLPDPVVSPDNVLVGVLASLISAGTERYVVELAQSSLLSKARQRPDHVRRVIQKIQSEGLRTTVQQVRAKLDEPMPLGYSAAGVVLECGSHVQEFKPGDRVAVAAPHAGIVSVGRRLCAPIPDGVAFDDACYAGVGAIALQGVRLARVQLGERVLVIGLGLIGLLAAALLKAQGCTVIGMDPQAARLDQARALGVDALLQTSDRHRLMALTAGVGADAVVITAATTSNEPIDFAADVARPKGRIVLVGVTGLTLPRAPFFQKELEFTVSSSLGAGRGDATYEERGQDYPIGFARWTAQRNMEAVLLTIASGRLPVRLLTSHRFDIDHAGAAYELISSAREPYTGVVLTYPQTADVRTRRIDSGVRKSAQDGVRVSFIGAGNFTRLVLLPALTRTPGVVFRGMCTAKGLNAVHTGDKFNFAFASSDAADIFTDPDTDAVFVTTRHDQHKTLVVDAIRAGKPVFVEKPLCIKETELDEIESVIQARGSECPQVMVGFNRRFTTAVAAIREHFRDAAPISVTYRFSPGALPSDAWPHDPEVGGGRLIGEACHAIDTCIAIVGSLPKRVFAESVVVGGSAATSDDRVFITMRHENGSTSCIAYQAGGDASGPRERIEVFGGGRSAVLDEWARLELWKDGSRTTSRLDRDKGHGRELLAFITAIRNGTESPISWSELRATTAATLAAVASLRDGCAVDL